MSSTEAAPPPRRGAARPRRSQAPSTPQTPPLDAPAQAPAAADSNADSRSEPPSPAAAPPGAPGRDRRGWPTPIALALLGPFLALHEEDRVDPAQAGGRFSRLLEEAEKVLAGIEAYQRHPLPARKLDRPVIWSGGGARLLDYGGEGPVAVATPSLVNRATVLDLIDERSLMSAMAASGLRALMLDWGEPDGDDLRLGLDGYARRRLAPALRAAAALGGGEPPALMGYCMSGALCLGTLSLDPTLARRFATVAAPWDFSNMPGLEGLRRRSTEISLGLEAAAAMFGAAPGEALQTLFALRDPALAARKFRDFAKWSPASFEAKLFVALEDWANDGVPLAARVAREAFHDWFLRNKPSRGLWRLGGHQVDPKRFARPALILAGSRDMVAPPESTRPLAEAMPQARHLEAPAGHVGLIVGGAAPEQVWRPLFAFLSERSGEDGPPPLPLGTRPRRKANSAAPSAGKTKNPLKNPSPV